MQRNVSDYRLNFKREEQLKVRRFEVSKGNVSECIPVMSFELRTVSHKAERQFESAMQPNKVLTHN